MVLSDAKNAVDESTKETADRVYATRTANYCGCFEYDLVVFWFSFLFLVKDLSFVLMGGVPVRGGVLCFQRGFVYFSLPLFRHYRPWLRVTTVSLCLVHSGLQPWCRVSGELYSVFLGLFRFCMACRISGGGTTSLRIYPASGPEYSSPL